MTLIPYRQANPVPPPSSWVVSGFDVKAALAAGGGVFTKDSVTDASLVSALDSFPGVYRADGGGPALDAQLSIPGFELIEWFGHSYGTGSGLFRGDRDGYVDRVAHMLGAHRRNNRSWSAAVASWGTLGAAGDGGWQWFITSLPRPGASGIGSVYAESVAAPYVPRSQVLGFNYGINDLARLGSLKPRPFIEALRTMMSFACASAVWPTPTSSAWAFTGTWSATGVAKFSNDPAAVATLTLPADSPGNRTIALTVCNTVAQTTVVTYGIQIDGVDAADWVVDWGAASDSENSKQNAFTLRLKPEDNAALRAAGSHTIAIRVKSAVPSGTPYLTITDGHMECDPAYAPVMPVLNLNRLPDYTAYGAGFAHGSVAGSDPMTDASVAAWNAQLPGLVAEFTRAVLVDVDSVLAKDPLNFQTDKLHPNQRGHLIMAEAIAETLVASGKFNSNLARALPDPDPFFEPVGTAGRTPFTNSWVNFGATLEAVGYQRRLDGMEEIRGWAKNGSSPGSGVFTLPVGHRPNYGKDCFGNTNGNVTGIVNVAGASSGVVKHVVGNTTAESFEGTQFRAQR